MAVLCRVMGVSRSGYYIYLKGLNKPIQAEQVKLDAAVKDIFKEVHGNYGSRRMSEALRKREFSVGRHQARSLMKKLDLTVISPKRFKATTNSKHKYDVAPNVLNREFNVTQPNSAWVVDITYIWTKEGWLYLAAVLDLYSRRIVGWAIEKRMTADLTLEALRMAWWSRRPGKGLIHHSDRGSQYASHEYQKELTNYGMICSMSRKGNCWDNAVMERFFRSLKSERVDHKVYSTRKEARVDIIDYIVMFYNSNRLHSYLNYQSPIEFEKADVAKAA